MPQRQSTSRRKLRFRIVLAFLSFNPPPNKSNVAYQVALCCRPSSSPVERYARAGVVAYQYRDWEQTRRNAVRSLCMPPLGHASVAQTPGQAGFGLSSSTAWAGNFQPESRTMQRGRRPTSRGSSPLSGHREEPQDPAELQHWSVPIGLVLAEGFGPHRIGLGSEICVNRMNCLWRVRISS